MCSNSRFSSSMKRKFNEMLACSTTRIYTFVQIFIFFVDSSAITSRVQQTSKVSKARKCLNVFLIIVGPIRLFSLYFVDIFLDIFNASLNFYPNCHSNYFFASIAIMIVSYLTTATYLFFKEREDFKTSILHPIIYA